MSWSGIMIGERTPSIRIRQTLTGQRYVDSVLQSVVRLWRGGFGDLFLFMQDNAPPHTDRVAKNFLESEGVAVLEWPSCSPDLNRTEHLWDRIKRRIRARQNSPGNTDQLIQAALEEWGKCSPRRN
nr:unnamed protein product [Callosobruchus analis]